MDERKIEQICEIKIKYLKGELEKEEGKRLVEERFQEILPEEFALAEQKLKEKEIPDALVEENMNDLLEMFSGRLVSVETEVEKGHPVEDYLRENQEIKILLKEMEERRKAAFIRNPWLEIYEKLRQYKIHLERKQNQLYPALERLDFDRPSRIMWMFDDHTRDVINKGYRLLFDGPEEAFLQFQEEVIETLEDIIEKEEEVLYPTALRLLKEKDWVEMKKSDKEIGYCLIVPNEWKKVEAEREDASLQHSEFMKEFSELLGKYGIVSGEKKELDVAMGKLQLEQINLIFQHLPVDLSFVDEKEIVKFYSDTKHRIFPRSAGVIGRNVKNCHPATSVHIVEEIIEKFRNGEEKEAEFWLEMNGKFIYILYTAVRDKKGNFRGVLEMMQDITKLRRLEGSRTLLTWEKKEESIPVEKELEKARKSGLRKDMKLFELLEKYPQAKEYLMEISPKYKKLNNPVTFRVMSKIADLETIAGRGGFTARELIARLEKKIKVKEME